MDVPQRNDGSDRYWKVRIWIEVCKTAVWVGLQTLWHAGSFGPF